MIYGNATDPAEFNKLTGTSAGAVATPQVNPLVQSATPAAQAAPGALAGQEASAVHPNTMAFYQALMQANSQPYQGQGSGQSVQQGFNPWAQAFPWLNNYQQPGNVSGMWSS